MIFPFLNGTTSTQTTTQKLPIPKEYSWDFVNNNFILKDGKFVIVEGAEAIKVWVYKALLTQRKRFLAYSWNYGHELESLIGINATPEAINNEAQRYIFEALLVNPYIKNIKNLSIIFDGDTFSANLLLETDYGNIQVSI
jgi:hypothetical protein